MSTEFKLLLSKSLFSIAVVFFEGLIGRFFFVMIFSNGFEFFFHMGFVF